MNIRGGFYLWKREAGTLEDVVRIPVTIHLPKTILSGEWFTERDRSPMR